MAYADSALSVFLSSRLRVKPLAPLGAMAAYRSSTVPIELTASVEAGLTYQVDVVAIATSIGEFQLSTMLR